VPLTAATVAQINQEACEFFVAAYPDSPAQAYVTKRAISPETAGAWRIGYAPAGSALLRHLAAKGYGDGMLIEAGLARVSEREDRKGSVYDFFRDRVMLPILGEDGSTVLGFGSRRLCDIHDSVPKYMNSPQTALFTKGETLFGLGNEAAIRATGEVFVVEGNFDLLALASAGVHNAVAPCGTSFTAAQLALLATFGPNKFLPGIGPRISLVFDADDAGVEATRKGLLLPGAANVDLGVITIQPLTEGVKCDPDDVIREGGFAAWQRLAASRTSRWRWLWTQTLAPYIADILADDPDAMVCWKNDWARLVVAQAQSKAEATRLFDPMEKRLGLPAGMLASEYGPRIARRA
jgi:DNA primase